MLSREVFKYQGVKQKVKYERAVERAYKYFTHNELDDFVTRKGCHVVKRYFYYLGFKNLDKVRDNFITGSEVE